MVEHSTPLTVPISSTSAGVSSAIAYIKRRTTLPASLRSRASSSSTSSTTTITSSQQQPQPAAPPTASSSSPQALNTSDPSDSDTSIQKRKMRFFGRPLDIKSYYPSGTKSAKDLASPSDSDTPSSPFVSMRQRILNFQSLNRTKKTTATEPPVASVEDSPVDEIPAVNIISEENDELVATAAFDPANRVMLRDSDDSSSESSSIELPSNPTSRPTSRTDHHTHTDDHHHHHHHEGSSTLFRKKSRDSWWSRGRKRRTSHAEVDIQSDADSSPEDIVYPLRTPPASPLPPSYPLPSTSPLPATSPIRHRRRSHHSRSRSRSRAKAWPGQNAIPMRGGYVLPIGIVPDSEYIPPEPAHSSLTIEEITKSLDRVASRNSLRPVTPNYLRATVDRPMSAPAEMEGFVVPGELEIRVLSPAAEAPL
ncbi:hypothetical protein BC829DRAFT_461359 [Chytridium lagenaria]|nr:hypothetical protein BC829DRAFT_461359 [Chytridium lagenaria]